MISMAYFKKHSVVATAAAAIIIIVAALAARAASQKKPARQYIIPNRLSSCLTYITIPRIRIPFPPTAPWNRSIRWI